VQENDFKYLDAHFGLNEITSYQSQRYEEIREEFEDRQVKNSAYHALESNRLELREKLARLLLLNKDAEKKGREREDKIARIQSHGAPDDPLRRKELGRLRGARRTSAKHYEARQSKIEEMERLIERTEARMETTSKEVSRLETLISREAIRLNGERKGLMDVIKITARNLFYEMLTPFKAAYNNFRDDHVWFRHLIQSGGVIEEMADSRLGYDAT